MNKITDIKGLGNTIRSVMIVTKNGLVLVGKFNFVYRNSVGTEGYELQLEEDNDLIYLPSNIYNRMIKNIAIDDYKITVNLKDRYGMNFVILNEGDTFPNQKA